MSEYNPIVINWAGRVKRAGLSFLIVNLGVPWALRLNSPVLLRSCPKCFVVFFRRGLQHCSENRVCPEFFIPGGSCLALPLPTDQNFPQIWSFAVNRFEVKKKHVSVQLWLGVRYALFFPFRSAARLNHSSPSTTVALKNVHLPTTWQESELMFRTTWQESELMFSQSELMFISLCFIIMK